MIMCINNEWIVINDNNNDDDNDNKLMKMMK